MFHSLSPQKYRPIAAFKSMKCVFSILPIFFIFHDLVQLIDNLIFRAGGRVYNLFVYNRTSSRFFSAPADVILYDLLEKYTHFFSQMSKIKIPVLWLLAKLEKRGEYSKAVLVEERVIEEWTAHFFWWPEDFYRRRTRGRLFPQHTVPQDFLNHQGFLNKRDNLHRATAWFGKLTTSFGHFSGSTS